MIEDQDTQRDFDRLLGHLSDGGLCADDARQLELLLESDRDLRRQYLDYCQMHALLRSEHGLLTSWSAIADVAQESGDVPLRLLPMRRRVWFSFAAAAALVAVAVSIAALNANRSQVPYRGAVVAMLNKSVGARFAYGVDGESIPCDGLALRQGVYDLKNGLLEVKYDSGAVLLVQAPATFELIDRARVRLEDGQMSAHVPEAAIGFRIDSPGATVIDMGTDFAVQAVRDLESEVHVFQGEVLVDLHGDKGRTSDPLRLVTGEATRVDFLTGMPSGIDLDSQQFLRTLQESESDYSDEVLKLDPAVYYRMEPAGDGSQLIDSAGSTAHAQIHFGRAVSPVWTAGKIGAALELGGTALQTYAAAPSYPQAEGDEIAVVGWVYARSRPRWASIAKNWAGGNYDRGQFHFGLNHDSGELEAHIVDSSGQEIAVCDSQPLPLRSWHHVAFVADGEMLRLYRNGREVDAKPYHKLHRDPRIKALAIGTKLNLSGTAPEERDYNMWDGRLDELAVFNHALSADQVQMLYRLASAVAL